MYEFILLRISYGHRRKDGSYRSTSEDTNATMETTLTLPSSYVRTNEVGTTTYSTMSVCIMHCVTVQKGTVELVNKLLSAALYDHNDMGVRSKS